MVRRAFYSTVPAAVGYSNTQLKQFLTRARRNCRGQRARRPVFFQWKTFRTGRTRPRAPAPDQQRRVLRPVRVFWLRRLILRVIVTVTSATVRLEPKTGN